MIPPTPPAGCREQIAIDGPAAAGKSTLARNLATALGANYINTGAMYRTLAWAALSRGIPDADDETAVADLLPQIDITYRRQPDGSLPLCLDGHPVPESRLRTAAVAAAASAVARYPAVRQWMLGRQRATAELGLIVMEGRDVGTVIFPAAHHKFYITATPLERARRRLAQQGEIPDGATLASVAADIAARDHQDSTRKVAPLRPAEDAIHLDTTALDAEQVLEQILQVLDRRWRG